MKAWCVAFVLVVVNNMVVVVMEVLTRAFIQNGGNNAGGGILANKEEMLKPRWNSNVGGGSITMAVLGIADIERDR